MASYIGKRLLMLLPVAFGVTVICFLLIHLIPGDPAQTLLGFKATPAAVAALNREWGLNRSFLYQYWLFLDHLVHGNLGRSFFYDATTTSLIVGHLPVTLLLLLFASIMAIGISVPLAVIAAVRPRGVSDQFVRAVPLVGIGMPSFWIGTMLILVLALRVKVFPVGGYGNDFTSHLYSLILPGLTVALSIVPMLTRSLRVAMIEALQSEYVAFGRSKGLPEWIVLFRYGLRNASISGISVLGIQVGFLVGGTLVVENVFALPGLGTLMIQSIFNRDFPVVQGITLVFAVIVVLVYLLTDLAYAMLDPRIRLS